MGRQRKMPAAGAGKRHHTGKQKGTNVSGT